MTISALPAPIDVARAINDLSLEEKIKILAGKDTWSTHSIERLNIPSITTSDGPQGVRGTAFFNGPKGCLFPSGTAMAATFDVELMHSVGNILAIEAREKGCQVALGPTVCLQRSPLIGRGFEAFAEDPFLSGTLASTYINGIQEQGVAACIKHYAAHDQSTMSLEDSIRVSERTMREIHLLPFQIAIKNSSPWCFMTAYHRINGVHASEDPWLIEKVLRSDWGWDGLVMSDWFGTYSTAEAINAGLDLEMPGPSRWRSSLLLWAVMCRKVKESTLNMRVRNLLNLINKVRPSLQIQQAVQKGDTTEKRAVCRRVASDCKYGLIGSAVSVPAVSGGGSADLVPHYISTPLDAITEVVGADKVEVAIGSHNHLFTPLLSSDVSIPGTQTEGYLLEWFHEDPRTGPEQVPIHSLTTTQAQMYFADSLPKGVPDCYWLRVRAAYTAPKTTTVQFGLCVIGKAKLYIDDDEMIDLFTSQPPKTLQTPMFNLASMEAVAERDVQRGKKYQLTIILKNDSVTAAVGGANSGGLRIGCCEKLDPATGLADAVDLATRVDVPIIIAGLNSDYESEAIDRKTLSLPPAINNLIEQVLRVNPNTIVVTQSGSPITMPWVDQAPTLVHAWFGGQETGNAIADVLFGKVNPSGRLSVTFPKCLEDTPAFLNFGKGQREIMYGEGIFVGYRYYEKLRTSPLFYFGYGLSYTKFDYSNLQTPDLVKFDASGCGSFAVSVDVHNSGSRDGLETVQVYIQDVACDFDRPRKELKGFTKVFVTAGSSVTARIKLDKYALSYWSEEHEQWIAEQGTFRVIVSRSANPADEMLSKELVLETDFLWKGL